MPALINVWQHASPVGPNTVRSIRAPPPPTPTVPVVPGPEPEEISPTPVRAHHTAARAR